MKMLSKIMKVMVVLLAVVMIASVIPNMVFAEGTSYEQLIKDMKNPDGDESLNSAATSIVGAIISVTRIIAVGVAIIMLIAVAMKYMSAAPGDRAEIKKHAVIYVVGAVVLFGASGLLGIIQKFADNIK